MSEKNPIAQFKRINIPLVRHLYPQLLGGKQPLFPTEAVFWERRNRREKKPNQVTIDYFSVENPVADWTQG